MSCENDATTADPLALGRGGGGTGSSLDSQNLYALIAQHLCHGVNLNEPEALAAILRPHHERDLIDDDKSLTNLDEDDGVMLNIRFTELCRVKAILLSTPPSGDERADRCRIWVNRPDGIDLAEVDDIQPDQDFQLLEGERGAVDFPVKASRFANVSSLSLHFSGRQHPGRLRLYYCGFKGASRAYQKQPGEQLTVAAENAADSTIDGVRERYGGAQTTIR